MKYLTTLILAISLSLTARAHNPQLASVRFMQEDGDKWGMLIAVPFATCELALQSRYPGLNLDSVDINRFNDLLTKLVQDNCLVIVNGTDTLSLTGAKIMPGHETEIYFQVGESVDTINSLKLVFNAFASLKDQQTILSIYQWGKSAGNFILNTENQYTIALQKNTDGFSVMNQQPVPKSGKGIMVAILGVIMVPAIFFSYKKLSKA